MKFYINLYKIITISNKDINLIIFRWWKMRGKKIMEGIRGLINNHRGIITVFIIIYVMGVLNKIIRNIFKEKNNKKR